MYIFPRPRALQYSYREKVIAPGGEAGVLSPVETSRSGDARIEEVAREPIRVDDVAKHRERLDLFIDLVCHLAKQIYPHSSPTRKAHADVRVATLDLGWHNQQSLRSLLNPILRIGSHSLQVKLHIFPSVPPVVANLEFPARLYEQLLPR
jgi:hypothetical protein